MTKKSTTQPNNESKDYPNKIYLSLTAEVAVESDYGDIGFFPSLSPILLIVTHSSGPASGICALVQEIWRCV